jgi:hypothetical protein
VIRACIGHTADDLQKHLVRLHATWHVVAGEDLARATRPLSFEGAKARRLLVHADAGRKPPCGAWNHLSSNEAERRTFTSFRAAINRAIAPHEVDHVDFVHDVTGRASR